MRWQTLELSRWGSRNWSRWAQEFFPRFCRWSAAAERERRSLCMLCNWPGARGWILVLTRGWILDLTRGWGLGLYYGDEPRGWGCTRERSRSGPDPLVPKKSFNSPAFSHIPLFMQRLQTGITPLLFSARARSWSDLE